MPYEVVLLSEAAAFLRQIQPKLKAKALRTIDLLQQFGPRLQMPHTRGVVGFPLFELRVRVGSDILRLCYFSAEDGTYVMTSGYVKKTDKLIRTEIERAIRLRNRYMKEGRDENGSV